jgi:hypothetical protein
LSNRASQPKAHRSQPPDGGWLFFARWIPIALFVYPYLPTRRKDIMSDKYDKVVLAYSGGLDTSVIVPWLKENYDC